jgi:hypothetical protein
LEEALDLSFDILLMMMMIANYYSKMLSDPVTGLLWPRVWVEVQLYSSMTAALEAGEWSAARRIHKLPPEKTWYQIYRRLGVPQGRSGRAENLVPTGNDPGPSSP